MKTPAIKRTLARKAVETTAKHSAHGAASKLKRNPIRSSILLAVGALAGVVAGWMLARGGARPASAPSA